MNPFADYMKLLKLGIKNADKVIEGISNKTLNEFNLLNDEQQKVISDRMDICLNCPYNSKLAPSSDEYLQLFGKPYATGRSELHCSLCGCVIEFKTASLTSNCGIEAHNDRNPDKPLLLKWTKYEK